MHGEGPVFYRMTLTQRIQHIFIAVTFSIQVLTGLPIKFPTAPWALPLINMFGGVFMAGRIHRASGVVMFLTFLFIAIYIILSLVKKCRLVLAERPATSFGDAFKKCVLTFYNQPCFPTAKDGRDIKAFFKWVFHLSDERPDYAKFCWKEKFDYLAVFWGVPVFTLTGPFLWAPSFFTNLGIPPIFINIATIVHSDETVLATGVIFIWHFYNVIFAPEKFPMDPTVITGTMSSEHMMAEHSYEYRRVLTEEGSESPSIIRDVHHN